MDVDPAAHEKAVAQINSLMDGDSRATDDLKTFTVLKNFRHIKSVLGEIDEALIGAGVDGILMDLGMSSMQVLLLKALCSFLSLITQPMAVALGCGGFSRCVILHHYLGI